MDISMASSEKGKKRIVHSIDRLTDLPDAVLCHILSFLPTKFSVATSILSRRWRFMWAHVPNLDFNEYYHEPELNVDVLFRVMSQYKVQNMNRFLLIYTDDCLSEFQLETLIIAANVRNVKTLHLHLASQVRLPNCIFTCKTLIDLRLEVCDVPIMDFTVSLPVLKRLHLFSLMYVSDESLPLLLSGCPVLEELTIDQFVDHPNMGCCCISSTTIKRLVLDSEYDALFGSKRSYNVKIDAPALKYLQLHDHISKDFSVGLLTSLIEADVAFEYDATKDEEVLYSRSVLEFVGRLCNVKCLRLSTAGMKGPNSTFSALIVKFHNLTKLELAADWRLLLYFLEHADNLEVLIIRQVDVYLNCWMEPPQVSKCLSHSLRTITFVQLWYTEDEFNIVRYLLRNAKVMKRMDIYCQDVNGVDLKAKFDAFWRISSFQRGSEDDKQC